MQLKLVLLGTVLLIVGVLAYSTVPNLHRTPVLETRTIMGPENITVQYGSIAVIRDISLQSASNELDTNLTVIAQHGDLSSLRLQLFLKNSSATCASSAYSPPKAFLVNQDITNQSIKVPIQTSGSYCFVFDNEESQLAMTKNVTAIATLHSSSEKTTTTNDGGVNMAGVGLGAFGFLVLLYGASRKAVIPWE